MTRWQDKVLREGNSFEQDVDTMLKELGYTPIKIYQRKGMPVNDPNGKIDRLYPDSMVQVVFQQTIPNDLKVGEPYYLDGGWGSSLVELDPKHLQVNIVANKVILADGWEWHNKNLHDDRERKRKDELYVAAGFWVVHISDHWFKSKKKKAEVKPLLDAAMKSTKKIEDYLAT